METLLLVFRNVDHSGRRSLSLPQPVANIDTLTDELETEIVAAVSPVLIEPATFDEAHHIHTTSTELVNLIP